MPAEKSCFTCASCFVGVCLRLVAARTDPAVDENLLMYIQLSGVDDSGYPSDRTVECPEWAQSEQTCA